MTEQTEIIEEEYKTTVEDLLTQYDSLEFYDRELTPVNKDLLYKAVYDEELRMKMIMESIFVNKLTTISRNYSWEKQYEHRPFHRKMYKQRLTNVNNPDKDNFGNVKGWGMVMSPEEWDLYEQAHNIIFELKDIEG